MLCTLETRRVQKRENGVDFFVCRWVGVVGSSDEPLIQNGILNRKRALSRRVVLVKSIFPTTEEELESWKKELKARYIERYNEETKMFEKRATNIDEKELTKAYLMYVSVPLSKIDSHVKKVQYLDSNGTERLSNSVNVIGFSYVDEDGNEVWGEELGAEELATRNLQRGLETGAYIDVTNDIAIVSDSTTKETKNDIWE